jgi:lambda family phage tail tape measure protein
MNDMVFGVRLTANSSSLVSETRSAREEFVALRRETDALNAASSKVASQYSGLNAAVKEHTVAVTDTDAKVTRLIDRYDPLGAKLRQLQADFKSLDAAAASGKIAVRDDARVDAVYARLQKEIAAASAATAAFDGTSKSAALSAGQLRMATQQLPMQFTDIATSLAAGQNPMMVMLQQGGQLKDSFGGVGNAAKSMGGYIMGLINPLTLTAAAVTAVGVVAWESYRGNINQVREELRKLSGDLSLMTTEQLNKRIDELRRSTAQKRADASAGGWGWLKDAEEAKVYEEELRRVGRQVDANRALEERLGNVGGEASKLAGESSSARRRELERQATVLQTYHDKQKTGSNAEIDSLNKIRELRKQIADMDAPKKQHTDPNATEVSRIEAESFRAQMEAMGVAAEQAKVYELARRGATRAQIEAAQAAAELKMAADAEVKASKESAAAWDESAKVIEKARTVSAEYVNQLEFENSLLGLSTIEVQKRTEARRIDLALEKELLSLRTSDKFKARDTNPEVNAAYKAAVNGAKDAAEAAKAGAVAEIDARDKVTRSWEFGSKEAIRKYIEQVDNAAAQTESLFAKGFKGAEDAITQFMMTGKADIRSFANSVIEEFMRINVARPMVSAGSGFLNDLIGGLFGGGGTTTYGTSSTSSIPSGGYQSMTDTLVNSFLGGGRASGGSVSPNTLYQVNENGPELLNYGGNDYLMMGGRGGYVKPLSGQAPAIGSGVAGVNLQVNVINNSNAQVRTQERQDGNGGMTMDVIIEQIESGIARNVQRGAGPLNSVMEHTFGLNRAAGSYR